MLMQHTINLIVSVDTEGGYAKDGTIPWDVPEDLAHFNKTTEGGVCIMGRYTYEDMVNIHNKRTGGKDIGDAILPGRDSFVVSSDESYEPVGATRVSDIGSVINKLTGTKRNIFVIGGHRLFIEALGFPCAVHMSIIKGDPYQCDKFFPVDVLNTRYTIVHGTETDLCYNVIYSPLSTSRVSGERNWEQFINENFRPI